ncbi:NYN domain-containing protein [Candidatus Woesearchaeota archaeon]|nr:NYN domain-containing protein [Candidatus Woesearchaeota archaeon]
MIAQKEQRVGIFVDVQNLFYSAKNLYKSKVNYAAVIKDAAMNRSMIRAIAYVIKADVGEEKSFFDALEKIGFEVRKKDLQIFYGGAKKGDWDVGIAMDVMRLASKLDVVVLVSGDGDFRDLLEHAKALGCRTEVIAFGKTSSSKLRDVADRFVDLDSNLRKYLIKPRAPPRTAPKPAAAPAPAEK